MLKINRENGNKKILIIKLGALGDLIIATPFIKAIIDNNKSAQIVVLTRKSYATFFEGWDEISLITLTDSSWGATFKILSEIRKPFWDKIYDFQGNRKSRTMVFFCNANEKIGNHRFPNTIYPEQAWSKQIHIFYRMKNLLEMNGIEGIGETPRLDYGEDEKIKINKWLDDHIFNKRFVWASFEKSAKIEINAKLFRIKRGSEPIEKVNWVAFVSVKFPYKPVSNIVAG